MPLYPTKHATTLTCQSGEVLAEDVILAWYSKYHAQKGKTVFLEQMTKFTEWLLNADEGMYVDATITIISITDLASLQSLAKRSYRSKRPPPHPNKTT